MKKLIALLLALCLLLTMAACNDTPDPDTEDTKPQSGEQSTSGDEEKLEAALWTLSYDPQTWTYDTDDLYTDEDYSKVILEIPDGEDGYVVNVEIRVSVEDAESFRSYLDSYGFDAYEYAVNNSYETVTVGGVPCLKQEGNYWGDPCLRYFARVEGAGATVFVEIIGNYSDDRVSQLMNGLNFTLTDVGNADFPWPWDGEPFAGESRSVSMGGYTVNSQWVPLSDPIVTKETFEHAVAYGAGGNVYILSDEVLKLYTLDGNNLVYAYDLDVDGEFESIQANGDGRLWLSAFMEPLTCYLDGSFYSSYEGTDVVTMSPDGTWGVSWFSSNECQKVTFSGETMSLEPIVFSEVDIISHLLVDSNYIYVCGSNEDGDHMIFIYQPDGTLYMVLEGGGDWGLGSVTFVARTANGFVALDANMRDLVFWSADGTFLGSVEDSDIFGTDYPWFCGGTILPDGSILVIMTEDRADQSAMELVAFQVSGF